jgi:hypothetical protein
MHLILEATWARCCNLRGSVRRMVEISDICQGLMAVPQGSLGDVWLGRTIVIGVVGDDSQYCGLPSV